MNLRISLLSVVMGLPFLVNAQIFNPANVLERKAIQKTNQVIDKAADRAVDSIFGTGQQKNTPTKPATQSTDNKPKPTDNKQTTQNSQQTNTQQGSTGNGTSTSTGSQPALQISSKYDFIAGEKVIFFDDFTGDNIGDFPVQWNTTGSGEVVTNNIADGRWFNITNGRGATTLDEPIDLPENYTIEFDAIKTKDPKNNNNSGFSFSILSTTKPKDLIYGLARPGEAAIRFGFEYNNSYIAYDNDNTTPDLSGREESPKLLPEKKYRISIWIQKERIRLYVGEEKVFDVPKAMSKKFKYNMIRFDRGIAMISNVRIATGLPDMRSKLITEGKLVSYGIYFDVNKDIVKPESAGTLKMIADVLNENPAVRIKIVGHTDSDGDDASNLDLSKLRGAAVKNALVSVYGIDASRIETDGKGEKEPVAPNDSAVNKAKNRRVEFIKL